MVKLSNKVNWMIFTSSPEALTPASNPNQKTSMEPPPSTECVVLLADPMLMQMPLEALQFLQLDNIISISRDFSLQMFGHRNYKEEVQPGINTELFGISLLSMTFN